MITRTGLDRRSGNDRRRLISRVSLNRGINKRIGSERREIYERRRGWVRVSPWSSASLGLKIIIRKPGRAKRAKRVKRYFNK